MTNQERRQLLDRFRSSGMEGSILDVFQAYNQGVDLISQHEASQAKDQPVTLTGPQEQREGLRPYHAAGDLNKTAVFKDVPANTPFNTNGMKVPINIDKYNEQGHLVESHKSVPPGVRNIPTGPYRGDVIETPAKGYQKGGFVNKKQKGGTVDKYGSPVDQNLVTGTTTKSDNTKVSIPSVSSVLKTADKKIDVIKSEDQKKEEYFNPEIKDISSGDWKLDAVYKNPWLMDVPIVGDMIKDKAKNIAGQNSGATRLPSQLKNINSSSQNYTGTFREGYEANHQTPHKLLDIYFQDEDKRTLPKSKYKPTSDYLEFLPSYSLKDNIIEDLNTTDRDTSLKEMTDLILEEKGMDWENFIKNKKTLHTAAGWDDTSYLAGAEYGDNEKEDDLNWKRDTRKNLAADLLGANLGHHKQGLAWDDELQLPYMSISDAWDFSPKHYADTWGKNKDRRGDGSASQNEIAYIQSSLMHKAGNPFKVYDRFYFDPETREYISDEDIESRQSKSTSKKMYGGRKNSSKYNLRRGGVKRKA